MTGPSSSSCWLTTLGLASSCCVSKVWRCRSCARNVVVGPCRCRAECRRPGHDTFGGRWCLPDTGTRSLVLPCLASPTGKHQLPETLGPQSPLPWFRRAVPDVPALSSGRGRSISARDHRLLWPARIMTWSGFMASDCGRRCSVSDKFRPGQPWLITRDVTPYPTHSARARAARDTTGAERLPRCQRCLSHRRTPRYVRHHCAPDVLSRRAVVRVAM